MKVRIVSIYKLKEFSSSGKMLLFMNSHNIYDYSI